MNDANRGASSATELCSAGRFAELLALSAFAVAQPLYVRLSTQTAFLLDSGGSADRPH
jgi:hypothetical protein